MVIRLLISGQSAVSFCVSCVLMTTPYIAIARGTKSKEVISAEIGKKPKDISTRVSKKHKVTKTSEDRMIDNVRDTDSIQSDLKNQEFMWYNRCKSLREIKTEVVDEPEQVKITEIGVTQPHVKTEKMKNWRGGYHPFHV